MNKTDSVNESKGTKQSKFSLKYKVLKRKRKSLHSQASIKSKGILYKSHLCFEILENVSVAKEMVQKG